MPSKTARRTWQLAESRAAKFHNPHGGKRTPLSGSSGGVTGADCMHMNGLYIECKFKASWAVWTEYKKAAVGAKKEGSVPVLTIFKKSAPGFMDIIHSSFIDRYIQIMAANRRIVVDGHDVSTMVGGEEQPLMKIFEGTIADCSRLITMLRPSAFNDDGTLKEGWWTFVRDDVNKMFPCAIVPNGFKYALYGSFGVLFKPKEVSINAGDLLAYEEAKKGSS